MLHPSISEPLVLPLFLELSVSAHVASDDIRLSLHLPYLVESI
jgi:hypothetical protein